MRFRKITLIQASRPADATVNEQLQWLGGSLGLFNPRDKDKSCFRIFITLIKSTQHGQELSSDELARLTGLSRGTVVYHLNKLMGAGIVETYRGKYVLRVGQLQALIDKLEDDLRTTVAQLRKVAEDLDRRLGLS